MVTSVYGGDRVLVDGDGATALHLAAAGGHLDVHRLLDSLRADQAAEVIHAFTDAFKS